MGGHTQVDEVDRLAHGAVSVRSQVLLLKRLPQLRSDHRLESVLSRESSFLFNNLFLVGIMFVVLWGTLFPVLSEAVRGVKISVAAPFFNQVNVPLGLALLFLSGVCPLIAWRKASARNLRRHFLYPLTLAFLATAVLYTVGIRQIMALIALAICLFALPGKYEHPAASGIVYKRHTTHRTQFDVGQRPAASRCKNAVYRAQWLGAGFCRHEPDRK